MKICSRCHESKRFKQFHRDSTKRDGLNKACKVCVKQYHMDTGRQKAVRTCSRCGKTKPSHEFWSQRKTCDDCYGVPYQRIAYGNCARCGNVFIKTRRSGKKYCNDCGYARTGKASLDGSYSYIRFIKCPRCESYFIGHSNKTARYCSPACGGGTPRPKKECHFCNKLFKPNRAKNIYCSFKCYCSDPNKPVNARAAKLGNRLKGSEGYIEIRVSNDYAFRTTKRPYMLEHRKIMSDYLGRKLKGDEVVHHRNGIRDDNRLENLELWVGATHPKGIRVREFVKENKTLILEILNEGLPKSLEVFFMRKRQFLFAGEIHIYLLESQRRLLRNLIAEKSEIPGLLMVERYKILREDAHVSSSTLSMLADWFPALIEQLRELEIKREAAVSANAALASRSL